MAPEVVCFPCFICQLVLLAGRTLHKSSAEIQGNQVSQAMRDNYAEAVVTALPIYHICFAFADHLPITCRSLADHLPITCRSLVTSYFDFCD